VAVMVNEDEFLKQIIKDLSIENLLYGNEDAVAFDIGLHQPTSDTLVINADSMSWSSDALPPNISLFDFGKKLVTMTVSDVITKGALPKFFLSTITTPKNYSQEKITELFHGMKSGCSDYNLSYLGGDLGNSSELVITGIVIGFTNRDSLLKRSNAKQNDLIFSTGTFGITGLGYKYYLEDFSLPEKDKKILEKIDEKLSRPRAVLEWIPLLVKFCNAAIDSSDGLFKSLLHLSNESKKGIYIDNLPIDPLLKKINLPSSLIDQITLFGGEEYEIIFTVPENEFELLVEECNKKGINEPILIGSIKSDRIGVFYKQKELTFSKETWDSFSGFSHQ
jgi:thiamine-monophosphate kinase